MTDKRVRRYAVRVPMTLEVEVNATDAMAASKAATHWADWLAPTFEQLLDYSDDHPNDILSEGSLYLGTPATLRWPND